MTDEPIVPAEPVAVDTSPDWKEQLEPYYQDKLGKFENLAALGKGYVELEQAMGSRVKIPGPDDAEGRDKLWDQLGRPDSPEKYVLDEAMSEGVDINEDVMMAVRNAAHKAGLTGEQWTGVMGGYLNAIKEAEHAAQNGIDAKNTERWNNFKVEWGETKTAENIELAKRAVRDSELLKDVMSEEMVDKDPIFVAFVSDLMRKAQPDTLVSGEQTSDAQYEPQYKTSPEMYANGESEEDKKARAYFKARGHKY
ncbi:MAG: hypothetical protein GY832_11650 [Chloroflexi bacterium]|nr:hypothetical protein [Chloroflexota bacterium]